MVWTLNPWQTLLWIVALEVVSLPLIVGAISSIIDRYYRAKEAHSARIMKAIANTIDEVTKKIKSDIEKKTNATVEEIKKSINEHKYDFSPDKLKNLKDLLGIKDNGEWTATIIDHRDDKEE